MGKNKKYALLDTDFLYKSHLARNEAGHTLAELVLDFADYEFFCHEMIKEELTRHEVDPDPNPWLEEKIKARRINLYSDRDIVNELGKIYGEAAVLTYISLLQISCDSFYSGFFEKYTTSKWPGRKENLCLSPDDGNTL